MKIVILGSGFVASAYKLYLESIGHEPLVVSRSFCYYPHVAVIRSLLEHYRPHVVINAAGYTGLTVDCCEVKKDECMAANVTVPVNVARECHKLSIPYLHISSGCVYDGDKGAYTENDEPSPKSFYSKCKLDAEKEMAEYQPYQMRIRMPFSARNHPRNWLVKLCRYEKILDGWNSVTFLDEFIQRSWKVSQTSAPGIYNCVAPGPVSTVAVARLLHQAGLRGPFGVWHPDVFYAGGEHVKRSEAVLDGSKFDQAFGLPGKSAIEAIDDCIEKLKGRVPSISGS